MNLLFITPSFPSQFHRIRALNLIKYLSQEHKTYLVSLTNKKNIDIDELKPYCQEIKTVYQSKICSLLNCLLLLFSSLPLEIAYCRNKKMNKVVKEMIKKNSIDLVYIKRLRSAQFVELDINIPSILDTTDAMSLYYERARKMVAWYKKPLFYEEWFKYKNYEKKLLAQSKNWVVCSQLDLDYLKKSAPAGTNLELVPNGVDADFYQPTGIKAEKNTIMFSGLMDKFVNIQAILYFVKDIFPEILEKIPTLKLYIVGPKPAPAVKSLASNNIIVTGKVPDIRKYILKSEVIICPTKVGTGTRNKILQAWSLGRPVVTTSRGLEGLEANDSQYVLIADSPKDFAQKTIELLRNKNLQEQLISNGYQIIKEKYDMRVIVENLNRLIMKLVSKNV